MTTPPTDAEILGFLDSLELEAFRALQVKGLKTQERAYLNARIDHCHKTRNFLNGDTEEQTEE